jgi:hypothetical protein
MAFYLAHAGSKLYKIDVAGSAVELTLPPGLSLSATRRGRFAILNQQIVMVHAPNRPLQIDGTLAIRPLTPRAPTSAPTVSASGSGSFTGDWAYVVTFAIMDGTRLYSESPATDPVQVTASGAASFNLTNIPVSSESSVNARRIYRTTVGPGSVYYLVTTIANNTGTSYTDTTPDSSLPVNATLSEDLGEPMGNATPSEYFEVITAWRDRLWAAGNTTPDRIFFSGNLEPWAWNPEHYLVAQPAGQDLEGVTAFAPRRDVLGVGKRRSLWQVIGTDPSNFEMIRVIEGTGIWAPDSVVVIRDEAYFLAEDGVYKWGPGGVTNLSRDRVHAWFTTDAYFNRATFPNAFALFDPRLNAYQLHLSAVGSTDLDRWVTLDLETGAWFGPHRTDAFVPTCGALLEDNHGLVRPALGSAAGDLYLGGSPLFTDDGTAIAMEAHSRYHSQGEPDRAKYWGELSVHVRSEGGGTLTITPVVGDLSATPGAPITHAMTQERGRLRRLGVGRFCQLRFTHTGNLQGCELRGYEIDPVSDLGRR